MRGKKGAAEEVIEQIPYILLTIIVMAGVYLLLSYYSSMTIDPAPVQANVFLYRVLYEPNIISFTDTATGKVFPAIIEDSNFKSEHLDQSIKYSYDKQVMAKFELLDIRTKEPFRTAYYNQVGYERLEPLAHAGLTGGAKLYTKEMPAIFRREMADSPAILRVTVILPV
jgi:hypothetical protein